MVYPPKIKWFSFQKHFIIIDVGTHFEWRTEGEPKGSHMFTSSFHDAMNGSSWQRIPQDAEPNDAARHPWARCGSRECGLGDTLENLWADRWIGKDRIDG